jgi:hypothetical protein
MLQRDSGTPWRCGNSQASALTATWMLGGKLRRAPDSRFFVEPREAFLEEAFAPFADDLARGIEPCGDSIVVEALSGVEDDPRSDDISIR